MITVIIERNYRDDIVFFSVSGHAQYAQEGEDIVCAAVSSIVQTAVFGLGSYLELEPEVEKKDGQLSCRLKAKTAAKEEVKAILETMVVGLKKTEKKHSSYLKIKKERGTTDD